MRAPVVIALALAVALGCRSSERSEPGPTAVAPGATSGAALDVAGGSAPGAGVLPSAGELIPAGEVATLLGALRSDDWYGIYLTGKKVGWAKVVARPSQPGEPGRYAFGLEAELTFGTETSHLARWSFYAGEAPHPLVEMRTGDRSSAGEVERVFRAGPDAISMRQTASGQAPVERTLPATAETVMNGLLSFGVDASRLRPGQSQAFPSFDDDEAADDRTTVTVTAVTDEIVAGVPAKVATIAHLEEGESQPTITRVAGRTTIEASVGPGMVLRLEDRAVAQSGVEGFEMIADAVPVDRALGDVATLAELRLVIGVPVGLALPTGPQQEVAPRADGRRDVRLRPVPGPEVAAAERRVALAATPDVDADAAPIVALARQLGDGARTDRERVDRIVDWVYRNLAKDLASNLSTASQVLAARSGDCTEHALLVTALARAAGVPAREVSGLMYLGDGVRRFGWHAWNQVALDGRWVAVDAAWGQRIADPSHLMLGTSDSTSWVSAMGAITIAAPVPEPGR